MLRIKNKFDLLITLLLVLCSGTVIFSQIFYREFLFLFLIIATFYVIRNKKINLFNIIILLGIFVFLLCNYLLSPAGDIFGYVALMVKFLTVFFILNFSDFDKLLKYYVYIIAVMCVVSIPFYLYGIVFSDSVRTILPSQDVWGHLLKVTPVYNYQDYLMQRNNGMYWEPGAFQAFINVAILVNFKIINTNKKKLILFIIFFITLVTTFSTTGYLVFFLILLAQLQSIQKYKLTKKSLITIGMLFLLIMVFLLIALKSGVILDKFNPNSNTYASYVRRDYDLKVAIELMQKRPYVGWGFNNTDMYNGYNFSGSSNSLLTMASQLGAFSIIFYFLFYAYKLKLIFKNKVETFIYFICLLILFSSENLIFQPIFIAPLFYSYRNLSFTHKRLLNC
ncbi:O-antigen ligase family protein [Priestia megaterium]|uniref:O-antigen ligase family protein n=1 Tax=Priestia megaterium TaxID=1404 RepID=UPI002877D553|nr:O-antigen ligase family protein [Priestia megaterium]